MSRRHMSCPMCRRRISADTRHDVHRLFFGPTHACTLARVSPLALSNLWPERGPS